MKKISMYKKSFLPLLLLLILSSPGSTKDFLRDALKPSPVKKANKNTAVYQIQNAVHDIYNLYKDSVVFISTEKTVKVRYIDPFRNDPFFQQFFNRPGMKHPHPLTQKRKGLGTGFIISKDGYVCTNNHVIAKMDSVTVKVNNKEYRAKVIGADPLTDIALLKIKGKHEFKPVFLGDSRRVKVGDMALAIGNPFGLDRTITSGIISAIGRKKFSMLGVPHFQTDASINPGNSGGPLINIDGEVIGVNQMIYSKSGGNLGIGFAIPINIAKKTLRDLMKYGKVKRGYIGVQISPLTKEFAKELGLKKPEGALVGSVQKGSPADKGGILVRDVIIRVKNRKIRNFTDLLREVSRAKIGKALRVTVWRNKQKLNLFITITERP